MSARHTKHGVKRKHHAVKGIIPILEKIADMDGVKKVVPAVMYSTQNSVPKPTISIQRETPDGLKLLAHGKGYVQDIFVVAEREKIEEIKKKIGEIK